ncbi:MAG: hypothetical protein IT237_01265, partial [Bacteroidia bacterium]|nr:hypothetical protein [Bacteroidia bacterium]
MVATTAPTSSDVAFFLGAGNNGNCTFTANVNVAGITVNGYTGTISQGTYRLDVGASNAVFSSGIFTGGSGNIEITGTFTLSGGTFTSTSGTLYLYNTVTNTSGTFTHNNGTVSFSSTASQTIPAWNYYSLLSGSTGARVLNSTGTIGIANVFTKGTNSYTISGSTIDYNGTASQNVVAFNYHNLTFSSTGSRVLASSGTIGISGTFTKGTNATTITGSTIDYNGNGLSQTVTAFNYNNLTISQYRDIKSVTLANSGTIGIAGVFSNTATFSSGAFVVTGSTVNYNGTSSQTIIGFNYNNLTISGARTTNNVTLANGSTIKVLSSFSHTATYTTGAIVNTNNTFEYNGTGAQTIQAFPYFNLTISGSRSGNITLANAGVISIANTFTNTATFTSGSFVNTNSTVEYNGTGAQSVLAFNYNNLIVSGNRTSNNVTFPNGGTVRIAKTFSIYASFSTGSFITTNNTVEFNGTLHQTITSFPYFNLVSSSTGTRSFSTTGIVKIAGTFTKGTNSYTDYGDAGDGFAPIYVGTNTKYWVAPIKNTNTVFVLGPSGFLLKSTDAGLTWTQISVGTTKDMRRIEFYDNNNGLIVASSGLILRTTNGGDTWTSYQQSESENFSGICYVNNNLVIATGGNANGIIYRSTDGGINWTKITNFTPSTPRALNTAKFIDNTTGFAVGLNETLIKTTDGGLSWSLLTSGTGNYHFTDLEITGDKTIFISSGHFLNYDSRIYKSTDLGLTLNIVNTNSVYLSSIDFIDNLNGLAVGGSVAFNTGVIFKTKDAGQTWTQINSGLSRFGTIRFANESTGYMYNLSGEIVKYTCCTEGGTVEYNGTGAQTVVSNNYHNLTISGARTTNSVTLDNNATISVTG